MSGGDLIEIGALCFGLSPKDSWKVGRVTAWNGKIGTVQCQDGEVLNKLKEDEINLVSEEVLKEDVDDLLNLTLLHDSTLLYVLKKRYLSDVIYTNIGAIVVALNPFNFNIPHYTDDNMPKYLAEGERIENNLPHSWAVAHNTYWELRNDAQNQTILVSGESGAGKTEASKIVMKYLAALSCKNGDKANKEAAQLVGKKINLTSPPLESFGNAKTVRNDNSSRFGKFMKIKFDDQGFLVGAHITKYLLEKSRIVTAANGERVYHSFYLLVRGADPKFKLGKDTSYRSLTAGNTLHNKEYDTKEEYQEVNEALTTMGVDVETVSAMWKGVAGVLHLMNLEFEKEGEGSKIKPSTLQYLTLSCEMWSIDAAVLEKEATVNTMVIGGQSVKKMLTVTNATDGRDSLAKATYDHEFGWLITKCNEMLDIPADGNWIGLLDIFGFEDFEVNSFEQICINLANESLQGHYNEYIFTKDMEMCRAEGIDVTAVEFPDNSECLQLVSGKGGILALLDEECALGQGSDLGFLAKVEERHKGNPFFLKKQLAKNSFIVHHYAGSVSYDVTGVLDKNRDTLKDAYKLMMRASTDPFIAALHPEPVDKAGKKLTVGGFFKEQVAQLMELINSTNPHWIRCVKPHPAKKPLMFDGVQTMKQLSSSGVLGTVKIRKAGYPIRLNYDAFKSRYRILAQDPRASGRDIADSVFSTMGFGKGDGQLGSTIAFMKTHAYVELEKAKKQRLAAYSRTLVMAANTFRSRMVLAAQRKSVLVETIQAFLRSKPSERLLREKEYETRKDAILEAARNMVKGLKDEVLGREAITREEDAELEALVNSMRDGFEAMKRHWYETKPERDRVSRQRVEDDEWAARNGIASEERAQLALLLKEMEEHREDMEYRQYEREEAERQEAERLRLEELERQRQLEEARQRAEREAARLQLEEQRNLALAAWAEKEQEKAELRERKRIEKERTQHFIQSQRTKLECVRRLHETEREAIARCKADFPAQTFDCSPKVVIPATTAPPSLHVQESEEKFMAEFGASPFPLAGKRPFASPSRAIQSAATTPRSPRRSHSPARSEACSRVSVHSAACSQPDLTACSVHSRREMITQARLKPDQTSSLEMVNRLRKLSSLKSPEMIISPQWPLSDPRHPENPRNPNWRPKQNGLVVLPDGTKVPAAALETSPESGPRRRRRPPGDAR